MTLDDIKKHAIDLIKGMIAAMIIGAISSALNFIGAHIPGIITFVASVGAATSTIKITR